MVRDPTASLPNQQQSWKAVKALYRLLDEEDVTFEALMQPHWQQTRDQIAQEPVALLVQDTTEVDYQHHPSTTGLGPIGNGSHHGFLLQSVLAVVPESRQVLGLAHQEPFLRKPAPPGETKWQRAQRVQRE